MGMFGFYVLLIYLVIAMLNAIWIVNTEGWCGKINISKLKSCGPILQYGIYIVQWHSHSIVEIAYRVGRWNSRLQKRPTTRPDSGSSPTSQKPGRVPRPGMVCISPRIGYKNPAPADKRTARIGRVNPKVDRCIGHVCSIAAR